MTRTRKCFIEKVLNSTFRQIELTGRRFRRRFSRRLAKGIYFYDTRQKTCERENEKEKKSAR